MQNLKKFFTSSVIARFITTAFLLVGFSNQQIGYYKFLRWMVCATALYTAFISYKQKEQINLGIWLFGLVAILFNPIFPFYLGKESWQITDIIVVIIFIGSTFIFREQKGN